MEESKIFKAYLRLLARDLQTMKTALNGKDYAKAEKLLDDLADDTQRGIED